LGSTVMQLHLAARISQRTGGRFLGRRGDKQLFVLARSAWPAYLGGKPKCIPMTAFNFVRWAARELSPDEPLKFLTEVARCPRATAKAWYSGHRRAPIWLLQRLRDAAQDRQLRDLAAQLDDHLQQREREPPRARGFMLRDPATGLDKRNRRGRRGKSGDAATANICAFGWKARDFALTGVDGKTYTFADARGPKGTLVVFICNHCPYVKASIDRIVGEANAIREIGIGTIAIMPSDTTAYWEDSFGNMQLFAAEHAFTFPYLVDKTQGVARAYDAQSTPDFFGFNAQDELQYRGRLDSSATPNANARRDLFEAMKQVAETGHGPRQQFPSMGSSIKWKN
jgi:peroxiredoxin